VENRPRGRAPEIKENKAPHPNGATFSTAGSEQIPPALFYQKMGTDALSSVLRKVEAGGDHGSKSQDKAA
jgi:hypothetical protein